MYRSLQDFQKTWPEEAAMTHEVIAALSDESLQQKVTTDGRSLGFLAWHVTQAMGGMVGQVGVAVDGPESDTPIPSHASEIATIYKNAAHSLLDNVLQAWTDDMLPEEVEVYGMKWTRGYTLFSLILHQAHHRGQMTVLMRQAGLVVPNTYGPTREGWVAMGLPVMP